MRVALRTGGVDGVSISISIIVIITRSGGGGSSLHSTVASKHYSGRVRDTLSQTKPQHLKQGDNSGC